MDLQSIQWAFKGCDRPSRFGRALILFKAAARLTCTLGISQSSHDSHDCDVRMCTTFLSCHVDRFLKFVSPSVKESHFRRSLFQNGPREGDNCCHTAP